MSTENVKDTHRITAKISNNGVQPQPHGTKTKMVWSHPKSVGDDVQTSRFSQSRESERPYGRAMIGCNRDDGKASLDWEVKPARSAPPALPALGVSMLRVQMHECRLIERMYILLCVEPFEHQVLRLGTCTAKRSKF